MDQRGRAQGSDAQRASKLYHCASPLYIISEIDLCVCLSVCLVLEVGKGDSQKSEAAQTIWSPENPEPKMLNTVILTLLGFLFVCLFVFWVFWFY